VCTTEVCAGGVCIYSESNAPECTTAVCGNGIIEGQEQCDDGNQDDTDSCTTACNLFACGDGFAQPGNSEECDDGNQDDADACSNSCLFGKCGDGILQASEECDDGNLIATDACDNTCNKTSCGDGIVQAGEKCDDGNKDNTDGCTTACKPPACGDGYVGPGEECDDGNAIDLDGCSNGCKVAYCGDSVVQLGEECDDGNQDSNDQCTSACKSAKCGDGFLQPGEACDDGNDFNNDGCSTACKQESCGDGVKQADEQCDDGNDIDNDGCTNNCTVVACGDGILQPGEDCDDGNSSNNDACTNTCKNAVCGDGFVGPGEECDDANGDNGDYCVQGCKLATCGDGFVFGGIEACDDKNTNEFDGCTKSCKSPGTVDGPFDPGAEGSSGVKLDENGNIIIDPNTSVSKKTSPLIWIANSQEGTISKIDTKTAKEVARYCTAPGCKGDPSRTTIGLSGDAVVANRGGGSIVKIASDKTQCVDRNGNGKIDTWEGVGTIPAAFIWAAGQPFSPDECVLWWTDLKPYNNGSSPYPRAAGFDAEIGNKGELSIYVYIGLYSTGQLLRVEAATGKVVKVIKVPGNPYGLVLDKDGNVWIQSGSALVQVDVKNNDTVTSHPALCMYGIAADPLGRIYTSGYSQNCVRRYDPVTKVSDMLAIGRSGGGVALDQNNHLWTGQPTGVRVDTNGPLKILGTTKNGGHGWAIDYDNNPWSIPLNGTAYQAFKHDPKSASPYNNVIAKPGYGNYTYSDMTGFQLTNAASKGGVFRKTFAGCGPDTKFESLSFDITSPANTTTTIKYRVAADLASLANVPWTKLAVVPPATTPVAINKNGGAIQIELVLQSKDLAVTPILSTLDVQMSNCVIIQLALLSEVRRWQKYMVTLAPLRPHAERRLQMSRAKIFSQPALRVLQQGETDCGERIDEVARGPRLRPHRLPPTRRPRGEKPASCRLRSAHRWRARRSHGGSIRSRTDPRSGPVPVPLSCPRTHLLHASEPWSVAPPPSTACPSAASPTCSAPAPSLPPATRSAVPARAALQCPGGPAQRAHMQIGSRASSSSPPAMPPSCTPCGTATWQEPPRSAPVPPSHRR
jgi:cysteine-rich repeat protein